MTCKGIGKCCPPISITKEDKERIVKALKIKPEDEKYYFFERGDNIHTLNWQEAKEGMIYKWCIFLDPKTRLCKVYKDRPNLCRNFECPGVCDPEEYQKIKESKEKDGNN